MKYSKEQIENVLAKARTINARAINKKASFSKKKHLITMSQINPSKY